MKPIFFERIELLAYDIYVTHSREMEVVEKVQSYLDNKPIGWHYYLDLAWAIRELSLLPKGSIIVDAGAGNGLGQFILSELGFNVISADVVKRNITPVLQRRYGDLIYDLEETKKNISPKDLWSFIDEKKLTCDKSERIDYREILQKNAKKHCGKIFLYNTDLKNMAELPDNCVDSVMSISALEHNDIDGIAHCIKEQLRVMKETGALIATISASYDVDWYDEKTTGWCLTEDTIRSIFEHKKSIPSNFSQMDFIADVLKIHNNLLDINLSPFYFTGENTAMPWGKWNPRYLPVGIIKKKSGTQGDFRAEWKPVSSMSVEDQLEYTRSILKGIIEKSGSHLRELKREKDARIGTKENFRSHGTTEIFRHIKKIAKKVLSGN
ncbi:MAG: methyltransferase domain-containing protein [Deltaproteobacteria bacterium]|nr:methyltransferase domain-containing protein [Candidatus Zymogenaceae bacterium]